MTYLLSQNPQEEKRVSFEYFLEKLWYIPSIYSVGRSDQCTIQWRGTRDYPAAERDTLTTKRPRWDSSVSHHSSLCQFCLIPGSF